MIREAAVRMNRGAKHSRVSRFCVWEFLRSHLWHPSRASLTTSLRVIDNDVANRLGPAGFGNLIHFRCAVLVGMSKRIESLAEQAVPCLTCGVK
jgi:hypothetical protein